MTAQSQRAETPDQALDRLGTTRTGLSNAEVAKRIEQYGYNELAEKKTNPFLKFLTYFWGPIPWMIEVAIVLSAATQDWTDLVIITILLVANAGVGFWEEFQAGNAIDAMKKRLALTARVCRDGAWKSIAARELVPGDIIRVRLGDIVPADAVLLDTDPVEVDQSALTGESLPATKECGQTIYSGSILRQGEAGAVVAATGTKTYFGKTAELVENAHTTSHFQKAVLKIGDYLIFLAIALVATIVISGLFHGQYWVTILRFSLVLTVAAIPVAMPTVLSVTMAVGARLLAAKQAIVRRLASVEEMAGIDVLCSDKTGTLTQNKLKMGDPFVLEGQAPQEVVLAGALASRAEDNDPIDLAVLAGVTDDSALGRYSVTHFQPFDPVHKRTEATVKGADGKVFKVTKGAPQVITALSSNKDAIALEVDDAVNGFARRGFRSLGIARCEGEGGQWKFLGVLPLFDPLREDSRSTIDAARNMGVQVKMVTGDQIAIAKEIASQLDLGTNILDASILEDATDRDDERLAEQIEQADGFAQVFPEHKYHIVEVLQQRGHITGMTGDGVNDAPALKKADAGIAVSGATDAARSASDIVLMAPGLSVIIDAIKASRQIFQRMNSYAIYRITETLRVLFFVTASILVFNLYPVTAVMIVLLALLNDGAILSIAYDNARSSNKPEAWDMRRVLGVATCLGIMGVLETFGLLYLVEKVFNLSHVRGTDIAMIQSLIYLKLSVSGHLTIFVARTRGRFWSHRPSNLLLGAVIGTQLLATLIVVYGFGLMTPIGWGWAGLVWAYALFWFLVEDQVKLGAYRMLDHTAPALLFKRKHKHWRHQDPQPAAGAK